MFHLHEKVVYPGHGVASINRIIEKEIDGRRMDFYELCLISKETTILVPTTTAMQIGMRSLSTMDGIQCAFRVISEPATTSYHHEFSASSWNKRRKQYDLKLRNGGLLELCEVYRDLRGIQAWKELSFSEKDLLQKTESLLAEEIAIVEKKNADTTVAKIRALCKQRGI